MATRMRESFPIVGDVPEKFRPGNGLKLDHYLVAGQLKPWQGDYADVVSPVCLRGEDDTPATTLNILLLS